MPETITSLIEKLEGAEVGSRELDREIALHLETKLWLVSSGRHKVERNGRAVNMPAYSTSLDAALALAERVGVRPYQADASIKGKWSWMVVDEARLGDLEANPYARATAATPALALCAAILRAQSEARV